MDYCYSQAQIYINNLKVLWQRVRQFIGSYKGESIQNNHGSFAIAKQWVTIIFRWYGKLSLFYDVSIQSISLDTKAFISMQPLAISNSQALDYLLPCGDNSFPLSLYRDSFLSVLKEASKPGPSYEAALSFLLGKFSSSRLRYLLFLSSFRSLSFLSLSSVFDPVFAIDSISISSSLCLFERTVDTKSRSEHSYSPTEESLRSSGED